MCGGGGYSNGAVRVLREIFVAGRVKEVDLDSVVLELQRRGGDGDATLLQPCPPHRHQRSFIPRCTSIAACTEGVAVLHAPCLPGSQRKTGGGATRACSIAIQSEVALRRSPLAFTVPASCTAPPYLSRRSVSETQLSRALGKKGGCGRLQEQLLCHCGLASVGVTDDGEGAAPVYFTRHLLCRWGGRAAHCETSSARRRAAEPRRTHGVQAREGGANAEPGR